MLKINIRGHYLFELIEHLSYFGVFSQRLSNFQPGIPRINN